MSGYLATVIAQARGAASQVRPRPRSRFETERGDETPPTELDGEVIAAPSAAMPSAAAPSVHALRSVRPTITEPNGAEPRPVPQQASPVAVPQAEGLAPVSVSNPVPPPTTSQPMTGSPPGMQAGPRIERTERVERIERTVVMAPPAVPEARISAAPPVPAEPPRAPGVQVVAQPLPPPVPAPPPAAAPIAAPVAAPPAARRLDPAPTVPEVTISIGVLDIRLTREAEPPRRPVAPPPASTEPPLPLADYLARRSGSGT